MMAFLNREMHVLECQTYQEENQSAIKSQLTELYKNYAQREQERVFLQEKTKNKQMSKVILGVFLVLIASFIILYYNGKRKNQQLETKIETERQAHTIQQKALSRRLKQSNKKLQETLKRIEEQEAEHKTSEDEAPYETFDERYEAFGQSRICLEILDQVNNLHDDIRNTLKTNSDVTEYKAFAMTLSQTAQLTKTVGMFFPNLYTALKAKYPTLDRKEWLHCCLCLLQLDKMNICVLLQESYYTCRRCVMKLEKVFDCRQGLSSFLVEQSKSR